MGRISTSYRYVIDIVGTDLISLEELGGADLEKLEKLRYFYFKSGRPDLNEIDILKELMSQCSYFKFRPDLSTLDGVGGENRKFWKILRWGNQDET